jgi:hypothetical protein
MTTFLDDLESALSAPPASFQQRSIGEQLKDPIHSEAEWRWLVRAMHAIRE